MADRLTPILPDFPVTTFESMSGVNTKVIFEMPSDIDGNSVFIEMKSLVTLAYSVYRAKIPVNLVGENTTNGFALGNKTVAGSIIKTSTFNDDIGGYVAYYQGKALEHRDLHSIPNLGTKLQISQKDFDTVMRDDLTPFNIYSYSISEYTGKILCDAIYGATIVNNGQVQSIENLITENTMSFIARYVHQASDVATVSSSIPSLNSVMTGSRYLASIKK